MKHFFLFLFLTLLVSLHQGRLDSHGGHTNENTNSYHSHSGKYGTNINPFHSPIRIQILKYGYPHTCGQEFASIDRCNTEKKRLERQNKGSDYSYICAIK